MSEQVAQAVAPSTVSQPPAAAADDIDAQAEAIAALIAGPRRPAATPEAKVEPEATHHKPKVTKEPEHLAAANGRKPPKEPLDPLNESDFSDEQLSKPEAIRAAVERITKARKQALELTRSAHNAIAHAERLKRQHDERDRGLNDRETRQAAWERAVSTAIEDMESGDGVRFLTAVGKLSKSGDPAGFWRNASLSLAKGEPYSLKEKAAIAADPELKARLEQLENTLKGRQQADEERAKAEFDAQVERVKTLNLEAAKKNEATPRVIAYASDERSAAAVRERLAAIMVSAHRQHGRPIDISQACEILESELSVHYELSQRADGKTTGVKETADSVSEAGRETSKENPPKPETSQATIPAALSASPASANRPRSEEELKQWQIRQLDANGFFD